MPLARAQQFSAFFAQFGWAAIGRAVRTAFGLLTITLIASPAFAKCKDNLEKKNYVNLEQEGFPLDLREQVEEIRKKVRKKLGWLPKIIFDVSRVNPARYSGIALYEPGAKIRDENQIGYNLFRVDGRSLDMNHAFVKKKFRRKGLSELMLGEILAHFFETETLKVELREENLRVFAEAYRTMKWKDAIRETYAYKRYARFGFTKISAADCGYATIKDPYGKEEIIYRSIFELQRP